MNSNINSVSISSHVYMHISGTVSENHSLVNVEIIKSIEAW